MAYLTTAQLTTIKQEINELLAAKVKKEIEVLKNTAEVDSTKQNKYVLLAIAHEIILPFVEVDEDTDSISNNISDADLQILIGKIYTEFFNLQYPN